MKKESLLNNIVVCETVSEKTSSFFFLKSVCLWLAMREPKTNKNFHVGDHEKVLFAHAIIPD